MIRTTARFLLLALATLAAAHLTPVIGAPAITPTSVKATSQWTAAGDGDRENLIDGSGLSGGGSVFGQLHEQNIIAATMWHAGNFDGGFGAPMEVAPPTVDGITLEFDLGDHYDLDATHVWNMNQTGFTGRGIKDVEIHISGSTNGDFTLLDTTEFTEGTGMAGLAAQVVPFTGATSVRRVRFVTRTVWSGNLQEFVGLSEVRFEGTVSNELNADYTSAQVIPAEASSYTAMGKTVNFTLGHTPVVGTTLTVVNNTGLGFINGQFSNLAQGQPVSLTFGGTTYNFVANYYGGTGNDLVLQWAGTRAMAWGNNFSGQLGDNSVINKSVPTDVLSTGVLSGKTVVAVKGGFTYSLALCSDGTLAAWGDNTFGQLGNGTNTNSSVPVAVNMGGVLSGKTVVAISAGGTFGFALCSDGTVAAWGRNVDGQLGNGTTTNSSVPVAVTVTGTPLEGKTVVAITAGGDHVLALCSDGTLVGWGFNASGQLGDGSNTSRSLPVAVNVAGPALAGKNVIALDAGGFHSLALCSDGTVATWGRNDLGQLGDGTNTSSNVPVPVTTTGTALQDKFVIALASGNHHGVALCSDNTLAAWGYNLNGRLGDGTTTNRNLPVSVSISGTALQDKTVVALRGGERHSLALCSDGTVAAWGYNVSGQLGDNTTTERLTPVAVTMPAPAGSRFIATASGVYSTHSLGLLAVPPPTLPTLTTATQSAVTATAATLGGEVTADGGAQVTDRGIVWATTAAPTTANTKVSMGTGTGIFSQVVTSLPSDSTIYVRAFAINSVGTAYGNEISFSTPSDNANLSSLTLISGALDPVFAPGVTSYTSNTVVTSTNSLTVTPTREHSGATIEARINGGSYLPVTSGSASGALALNLGPNTIDVRVTAQAGNTRSYTITVVRNSPPTDIGLTNLVLPENVGANQVVGTLSVTDPESSDSHVFTLATGSGSTDNLSFEVSGNTLRLKPNPDFEAKPSYAVRLRADDGRGGLFEKAFTITITNVNEAPSVTNVTASGDEDVAIPVTFSGSDPESSPLTYSIVTGPLSTEGTLGAIVGNAVVFTPANNFNGVVNFTYKATDGSLESNTGTATVTVNAVNDPPTITAISNLSILEDGTTGPLAFTIDDVDAGAVLIVNAWTDNQTLAPDGELVLGGSGGSRTIEVTPEPNQNGSVAVTVEVSDGPFPLPTAQATFTLTVTPVNDEPSFNLSSMPLFSPLDPNAEGRVWAWGLNNNGQIGDGSIGTAGQPVQVGSRTDWQKVATGDGYTFAIKSDGTLWAWGDNFYGQLGDGSTTDRDVPVQIGDENDWESVQGGDGHVVALKYDGSLWAWGRNDYGQLGDGSTSAAATPQRIGIDNDWLAVSAGSLHTVALKFDGSLWAWGRNQFGQLGTGSTTSASSPVRIGVANDWMEIAAGGLHTLALKANGSLWAWGRNADGQVGDGTTSQSNTPKPIGGDIDWVRIASGYTYSLAQKSDGSLWAWGRNGDGQVADGTRTNRLAPQQIGLDTDWAVFAAGRNHGLALKSDGSLWTWGDNDTYQMGTGSIGDLLVPTQLGTETWSAIAGGLGHTVAIEPESLRLTIAANSGPFMLPVPFATDILAGPLNALDEQALQNVTFEVENDDNGLFVTQPAIDEFGYLTLEPGVDAGTLTVTVRAKDDGGVANGGDDTSPPKTFSITITVAPEITLTGNSQEIDNGDDTPDEADHTAFGETPTVGGSVERIFTILNDGTAPLNLGNITLNGSSAFSITTQPAAGALERLGGVRTFSITFNPATAGLHTTEVSIVSDDTSENPYTFDISGVGITPEISITGNSNPIDNGDNTPDVGNHTEFGNMEVAGGSVSRTFTIMNTGTQDLTLSGNPLVSLSGSGAFLVTTMPAINPVPKTNGSTSFMISFNPASRGVHTAIVSIANNDESEAPYTFTVRGVGLAPAISITGNGNEIISGDSVPSATDHTLFGSIGDARTRTFTIQNRGNLVLNLGTPAVTLSGSNLFTLTTPPAVSTVSAESGTTTFAITFDPDDPGVHSAIVSIASDDTGKSPYTFTIRGNGLTELTTSFRAVVGQGLMDLAALINPVLPGGVFSGTGVTDGFFNPDNLLPGTYNLTYTVKDAVGQDLASEFTVTVDLSPARLRVSSPRSFATTTVGSNSRPQTIEIENLGGGAANSVRILLSGPGKKDFRIKQPAGSIRGGGKDSFQVIFAPRKEGARKAKATIMSSAGPVTISLSGRAKARKSGSSGHLPGG